MNLRNLFIIACAGVLIVIGARIASERQFKESCKQTCMTDAGPDSPESAFIVSRTADGKLDCECVAQ